MQFGPFACSNKRLGMGHYGTVLLGRHQETGERVAVKVEVDGQKRPRLPVEATIYRAMDGIPGFPRMRWFGRAHGKLALVLDLLGPSLRAVHQTSGIVGAHALKFIAEEAVLRLESLHLQGWLHCDVKPANLLLAARQGRPGIPDSTTITHRPLSLVDFGLSRRWLDPVTGAPLGIEGLPPRRLGAPVGTVRFASLRNHEGQSLGRRDDLESLAMSLAFLGAGRLPWSGLKPAPAPRAERFAAILECKQSTSVAEMGEGLPHGFADFFASIRSLQTHDEPDYRALIEMARSWPCTA